MTDKVERFFPAFEKLKNDQIQQLISKHLSDDDIELFVDHLEDHYGIDDEEEQSLLAQIMITGFLCGTQALEQ